MAHRILVVDDSPFILELVKDILIREGYEVDRAMNGHEAMLAIGENPPDLVLLDIIMPEMSGYQVCRLIRSDERLKALPVVMMTAKDTQKDRFWGLEVGADAYITKPIEEQSLLETITSLLKEKREPAAPVSPEELTSETLKGRADDILERKLLEMTIINETGKLFTYLDRPDALLQNVLMLICQVVDYDLGSIFVALPDADEKLVAIRYRNQPLKISKKNVIKSGGEKLAAARGVDASMIGALEIRLMEDSELDGGSRKAAQSDFSVNLRSSSGVLGSISLYSSKKEFFIPDDQVLVEMIASQLSVLLDNVQLLQTRDRQVNALELEKNRVEAIFRNMGEGVIVTDWSYRIIHANPLALQLLGEERGLEGQHLFDHIPRDTFEVLEEQRIGVRNPTWSVRFNSIRENYPLVASVAVVDEREEQTLGLIILLRDISAEDALDHLKSKFLGNISNHLRNPLTSLKGFLDLLTDDVYSSATSRQREYLDVMTEETGKLTEIVEDLLSLSKIELTDDFKVQPEEFSISETLLTAMINSQSIAQEKGLTLKSEIAEGIGNAYADKESTVDIINRLVSNAIKYSPPDSEIILGARISSLPGHEGSQEIYVRDQGPGIPADRRDAIFEKYREHRIFSENDAHGFGLGLPICKRLAEMMGGTIGIEAAQDSGSEFYFTLPQSVSGKSREKQ